MPLLYQPLPWDIVPRQSSEHPPHPSHKPGASGVWHLLFRDSHPGRWGDFVGFASKVKVTPGAMSGKRSDSWGCSVQRPPPLCPGAMGLIVASDGLVRSSLSYPMESHGRNWTQHGRNDDFTSCCFCQIYNMYDMCIYVNVCI